jgi:hypothetical protein
MSSGSAKSAPRKLASSLWRAIRALYYYPVRIALHVFFVARHRPDEWYRIAAPWIPQIPYPALQESKPRPASWYHFRHHFLFRLENLRINLDYACRAADVKGLALLYAMGAGDYLFTTPLLAAIKQKYPQLRIIAFGTKNGGEANSPLVPDLLQTDPNIDEVRLFNGKQTRDFRNYDYSDAVRQVPPGYLSIPMIGDHWPETRHRVISQLAIFGLTPPVLSPPPILHLPDVPAPHVVQLLEKIKQQVARRNLRGVVFLQVDARSSNYIYPQVDALAAGLAARGYFIVSASKLVRAPEASHVIDFSQFALMDSIHLLKLLRDDVAELRIVSVASVFWPISAALGVSNLGMQHFPDHAMHAYWYPNITVITHIDYPKLSPAARFLARGENYTYNERGYAIFNPDFVLQCFDTAQNAGARGSAQENPDQPVRVAAIS